MNRAPRVSGTARIGLPAVAGFTLLELLISLTIVALIFVAVLGAIQVGTRSWERSEARAEENLRTRALFESLARELTMVYPLRIKQKDVDVIAFRGESDVIEFATFQHGYGAAPYSYMMRIVTYAVEPARGLVAAERYPLLSGDAFASLQDTRVRVIDERVTAVGFRYLVSEGTSEEKRPPTWRHFWDPSQETPDRMPSLRSRPAGGPRALKGSDRLPLAVEVTLTIRETGRDIVGGVTLPPLIFPVQVGRGVETTGG